MLKTLLMQVTHLGHPKQSYKQDAMYLLSFVETQREFISVELSIRKLGSSSVLTIRLFEFTRLFLYIKSRDCMLA